MPLSKEKKNEIIGKFKHHDTDSGSSRIQIALLTERINQLTEHFKKHEKDHHSRRGLMKLVGTRRKLLDYIKRENFQEYRELIRELNLRR
jgi:small subunit ribosomal protein S15